LYQQGGSSRTFILSFDCLTTLSSLLDQSCFVEGLFLGWIDSRCFGIFAGPAKMLAMQIAGI
jgi:hypothetical protein